MIVNISAYKFVPLEKTKTLQTLLKGKCEELSLLGTILLGDEGLNMNVAGKRESIDAFKLYLSAMPEFSGLQFKESLSAKPPFEKLVVRVKHEIVTIRDERAQPLQSQGRYVSPETFKAWLDEKRDMLVLDTRNGFEYEFGTFEGAVHLNIKNFSEFPSRLKDLPDTAKTKTVVTFCTGGIRCEKAVLVMQEEGFEDVYQLEGGILNYFEKYQNAHFRGECFVFDERISVDGQLQETGTKQCEECFDPVPSHLQQSHAAVYCSTCTNRL